MLVPDASRLCVRGVFGLLRVFRDDLHHDRSNGERTRQEAERVIRAGFIARFR